jgi:DNA-binding NarL/FixJ family response regulator
VTGVLLCEDAADMRAMLREGLEDDASLHVVGEAADGDAAVRQAEVLRPDVVLLDLAMPGPDAAEVVAGLKRAAPAAGIVVLSGFGPERLGEGAASVDAYLPKTTDLAVVRATLRRVAEDVSARGGA